MPPERKTEPRPPRNDRERLAVSLRKAFPVSECGSFAGLLAAVDAADRTVQAK